MVIRFDFQIGKAKDIRLMTGSGGGYNAVIHIRPDHFFIQTALDRSVPYFSYRHGECAYDFNAERWYTMTVEFLGDEVIAHLDSEHLAHAKHPISDRTRQYFAIQVDEHPASLTTSRYSRRRRRSAAAKAGRAHLAAAIGKFPVKKSLEEQLKIQRTNAHEWYYQRDETYRALVKRVDELDEQNKALFPEVNLSHKEFQKRIAKEQKRLHESDPVYKETLFATYRANRALDEFLIAQQPEVGDWPNSRKKAELERLRARFADAEAYQRLVAAAEAAQAKLEADYPQLFVTDEEFNAVKQATREAVKKDPAFKQANDARAAVHRAQQNYLVTVDKKLAELEQLSKQSRD